jgi:hypothetical protein
MQINGLLDRSMIDKVVFWVLNGISCHHAFDVAQYDGSGIKPPMLVFGGYCFPVAQAVTKTDRHRSVLDDPTARMDNVWCFRQIGFLN